MYECDEVIKQLGRNIKAERIRKGLTQEKLAELYGCDRDYISKIECGKQNISIKIITKITNILGSSLNDIFKF